MEPGVFLMQPLLIDQESILPNRSLLQQTHRVPVRNPNLFFRRRSNPEPESHCCVKISCRQGLPAPREDNAIRHNAVHHFFQPSNPRDEHSNRVILLKYLSTGQNRQIWQNPNYISAKYFIVLTIWLVYEFSLSYQETT